jgi:hypothetical protein
MSPTERLVLYPGAMRHAITLLAALAVPLAAVAQAPEPAPKQVVDRYLEAFNSHDVEAMLALAHPEVQWLSVKDDKISVETSGHAALRDSMKGYFASLPTVRSTFESTLVAGPYVTVVERARWQGKSGERTQAALAVYEVFEGKVRRVWYYPTIIP